MEYNLTSPPVIKNILENHGFKFTKSLGQNFLIDQNVLNNIVSGTVIDENTNILEVGPGIGALTKELGKISKRVVSVEIDKSLEPILNETIGYLENVDIIFEDILKVDIKSLGEKYFNDEPFKVVANLPYYITTPIVSHLLTSGASITELVIMMQREVAERIVSKTDSREYGSITAFINYFGSSEILNIVPPTVFMPRPNVDSAVVKVKINHKRNINDLKLYERVLRAAFSQRRKTILNSMSSGLNLEKPQMREILEEANINPTLRAENLTSEDFEKISKVLERYIE